MLDAFIIESIRREEAERARARENRITLEVPMYREPPSAERAPEEEDAERGPIVIPLYRDDEAADDAA